MRRSTIAITALAASLLAALLAPASPAAGAQKGFEQSEPVSYIIETSHGKLYAEAIHPTKNGKIVKSPAILTYSPYSVLGRNPDAADWVPKGYTRIYVDVVGTGNSGGCYDYGGKREKETGYDIVEWIAKQKWSTGKVAMMGGSYNGTTATAAAVMEPPHLTTIVPEAAISRWYGYAYAGGIRFSLNNENPTDEGLDTPLAFDFGLAIPPPTDVSGEDWAGRVQSTITPCDEVEHTQHGYDDTPDYDKFWVERDYLKDANKIDIPVLVAHNYGDWNVKQVEGWNLFQALKNSEKRVMYFGGRYKGHSPPPAGKAYTKFVHQWMDHYLKGVDNGIEKSPSIISQASNYDADGKFLKSNKVRTRNVRLTAQEMPISEEGGDPWRLMPHKPRPGMATSPAPYNAVNANLEVHANHHPRMNHEWRWFESPIFKKDTRIFGQIKVRVSLRSNREWITVTPTIVDVKPACHMSVANQHVGQPDCVPRNVMSITRGWLDSRYRKGLDKQVMATPNAPLNMTVVENPIDYVVKKGHYLGLQIQSEIVEWSLPKAYPCTSTDCTTVEVLWQDGKTWVDIPIVNGPKDPADLFAGGGHAGH